MSYLIPLLLVLLLIAAAIIFVPSVKHFVLVRLGLRIDLEHSISGLTKVVKKLETHASNEAEKAKQLAEAAAKSTEASNLANKIASNVSSLLT